MQEKERTAVCGKEHNLIMVPVHLLLTKVFRYLYVPVTHPFGVAVLDGVQQLAHVEAHRVAPKPATAQGG